LGGASFEGGRASISSCTITGNTNEGVQVGESAHAEIVNNQITNNKGEYGDGIEVFENASAVIRNNTITGNARYGIGLWDGAQATITDNTIRQNGDHGINIGYGGYPGETVQAEISRNRIEMNGGCGVWVDDDPGIKITGRGNWFFANDKPNLCGDTKKFPSGFGD
jgi:parallel beta-helix repeat protein